MAAIQTTPITASGNALVDAVHDDFLKWTGDLTPDGRTIITTDYVSAAPQEPEATKAWENKLFSSVMRAWESVANIDLVHVDSSTTADIRILTGTAAQYPGSSYSSITINPGDYAFQETPGFILEEGRPGEHQSRGYYVADAYGWSESGTRTGGFGHWTAVHEVGHGLGLSHPFNTLPKSHLLNSGVFTAMAYETADLDAKGWINVSKHDEFINDADGKKVESYGYIGGPSAFDIAAIQRLYGANKTYAAEDTTYALPDSDKPGTYWQTIWDTGGIDEVVYGGLKDCRISLAAFSCAGPLSQDTAETYFSQVKGVHGGFFIADDFTNALSDVNGVTGVVIENASGGSGDDRLRRTTSAGSLTGRS